ncbi:MAG TPA: VOC family protein [Chromatiales bacterium]|nr:VOC family protein [Chromatiales bacterium]HEX22874.1 VOC family protein [Chromatiales bacterium]
MDIRALDHLVLTVADVAHSAEWYRDVLGMRPQTFGDNRTALLFGAPGEEQKINLHPAGNEFAPHAANPTPGSADLCLRIDGSLERVMTQLIAAGVEIIEGPVQRTGARGPIRSIYLRDPDGNLIELTEELESGD